jgi:coenzyme PQQ biosynthesis protein PqqD
MVPEGALRLNPVGAKILRLCDGKTFGELVSDLRREFPAASAEQVEQDTAAFLERLHDRRALDYE